MREFVRKVRRGLRKPPVIIAQRWRMELRSIVDRWRVSGRQARFGPGELAAATLCENFEVLCARVAARPYPAWTQHVDSSLYEALYPGDHARIIRTAEAALQHKVCLFGSDAVELGEEIDWQKDYVSDFSWPLSYIRDIDYADLDRSNDVKFPWELSRLQWLIPVGQAYLLTADQRYAEGARNIIDHWISSNPYAMSVNWACTLEAAMRIFSWTWFFHVFKDSSCWQDPSFQSRFLTMLYLHGEFTERYIERSDINGNHFTADAAALVVVGNFFGKGRAPQRWLRLGWTELVREQPLQIYPDGVCFEMSTAYHRFVTELFYWAAAHRKAANMPVPDHYRDKLTAMAAFTTAYTRPDGSAPFWGDADDARVLPFGGQSTNDHRYLPGLIDRLCGCPTATDSASVEYFWGYGAPTHRVAQQNKPTVPESVVFKDAGVFIMRTPRDHVFVDCGPVGLGGRGGHGHNDCLAVDAFVDGAHILSDCGAFTYTRFYRWRNRFRGSFYHNSPIVDDQEQNRFLDERYLWNVHYDAVPNVLDWQASERYVVFEGEHKGFRRLSDPVTVKRQVVLDRDTSRLLLCDEFTCRNRHKFLIPLQLAIDVTVVEQTDSGARLQVFDRLFSLTWQSDSEWSCELKQGWVSPNYGVRIAAPRLELATNGNNLSSWIAIVPGLIDTSEVTRWTTTTLAAMRSGCTDGNPYPTVSD